MAMGGIRKIIGLLCGAVLTVSPVHSAKREPEVLKPATPWNVNYADDWCRLGRVFGDGDGQVILIFDRFGPGQGFKLIAAGKRFGWASSARSAKIRFGPSEEGYDAGYVFGDLGKGQPAMIFRNTLRLDPVDSDDKKPASEEEKPLSAERIAAVREFDIGSPLNRPIRLQTGSMLPPFQALDKCVNDLLVRWGVDPVTYATLSRKVAPEGNPGSWVNSNDYPTSALFRGAQGLVQFRLNVDATGKPTACHIQQSSRPPEFDDTVCRIMMRRAHFLPALDKDGKAVPSFYRGTFAFMMG